MKRRRFDDRTPAAHSATLALLIAVNLACAAWAPLLCVLTAPLAGAALCFALSVVHECAHRTYFTSPRANDLAGRGWALLLAMNFAQYRREHMAHHRYSGGEHDTEPLLVVRSRWEMFRALALNPHVAPALVRSIRAACAVDVAGRSARRDAWMLIAWIVGLLALAIWNWRLVTLAYVAPYGLSLVLDNLVSFPEHARIGEGLRVAVTRSIKVSPALSFLLFCVNRHVEHHDDPGISARFLPIRAKQDEPTYAQFYASAWHGLGAASARNRRCV